MILKIGHRGAMGYEAGNTIKSFEKALALDVDMVELDVHLKDNKVHVIHDIEKWNLNTPSLNAVLDKIDRKAKVNIELKGDNTADPVSEIIKEYFQKGWIADDFLISSFKPEELKDFREACPKIKTALIVKKDAKGYLNVAKELGCFSINISIDMVKRNKEIINQLHKEGFKVIVWTVNSPRKIKWMKELCVDGVCSDYPDRLNKFL